MELVTATLYSICLAVIIILSPVLLASPTKSYDDLKNEDDYEYHDDMYSVDDKVDPKLSLSPSFSLSHDPDDIHFYLFRSASNPNASQELIFQNKGSVIHSLFKAHSPTVLLIHGFRSNSSSSTLVAVKNAFLQKKLPYNIVFVDWGKLSTASPPNPENELFSYPTIVRKNIPIVYNRIAQFLQFLLVNNFTSLDKLHLIGHSLGAHVSGGAAHTMSTFPESGGKKVGRVTGLDPAGPGFQGIRRQRRLGAEDAEFVDVYHTAAGTLGNKLRNEGHADFFPNGGHHQPGCVDLERPPFFEADWGSCSHSFVSKIYAASILRNLKACKCDPQFVDAGVNFCPGNCTTAVFAGEPCPSNARGQFYFKTSEDPYTA